MRRTLYVCRPLLNADDLRAWAAAQGFKTTLPDMHVTIAYSREKTTWDVGRATNRLRITGGERLIEKLGDAIVLRFASSKLQDRWRQIRKAGASWDYPGYKPHVSITEGKVDVDGIKPYRGPLIFGPERFEEIEGKDMAEIAVSPNNKAVAFRGKPPRERAMPVVSKAQNGAMHAAAAGESTLGIPAKVGREFTADQAPGSVKKLPQHKGAEKRIAKLRKRGLISDRAAGKHLEGKYGGKDEQGIDAASR